MANPSLAMIPSGYKAGKLYSVLPQDGTGDFTVARNSVATRVNESGLIEEMGVNVPLLDYSDGGCPVSLTQPQSTNIFLNSETLSTQTVTTLASNYTVSFRGTGTITFSGTYTGSLVGTGENDKVELTFTATAGALLCTVSGNVKYANCENLSYSTSWIETLGTTITRLQDEVTDAGDVNTFNSQEGVLYVDTTAFVGELGDYNGIAISDGTLNNRVSILYWDTRNHIRFRYTVGGSNVYLYDYTTDITNNYKMAISWKLNEFKVYVNGTKLNEQLTGSVLSPDVLNKLTFTDGSSINNFYGKTKSVQVFKTALTDQELQDLTTL
jgi:hypothetical protein